jgi:hypothetical protein
MRSETSSLRAPAETPEVQPNKPQSNAIPAREFLARVNAHVDEMEADRLRRQAEGGFDVLEYLKRRNPAPAPKPRAAASLPARFKREPDIFLGNVRFGRLRLFLSKFIGDRAWRGVSL